VVVACLRTSPTPTLTVIDGVSMGERRTLSGIGKTPNFVIPAPYWNTVVICELDADVSLMVGCFFVLFFLVCF